MAVIFVLPAQTSGGTARDWHCETDSVCFLFMLDTCAHCRLDQRRWLLHSKEKTDEAVCQVALHGRPSRTHCQMFVLVREGKKTQCLHNPGWGVGRPSSLGEFKTLCSRGHHGRENKVVHKWVKKRQYNYI